MLIVKSIDRKVIFKLNHLILDNKNLFTLDNQGRQLIATYSTEERAKEVFDIMNNIIEGSVRIGKTKVYELPLE